jgi:hypothetical protein
MAMADEMIVDCMLGDFGDFVLRASAQAKCGH